MSWRDNSSSANRSSTSDSNGGTKSNASSSSGDSKGGNYTYRSVPGARTPTIGNWNTGGAVVGTGSLQGGIRSPNIALPRAVPRPTGWNAPPPVPPVVPPVAPPAAPPIFSGWPSISPPPQQVPSFVKPRSVPVTNMPNTSYPPYNPAGDAFSRSWGLGDKGNRAGGLTGNF